MRNCYQKIPHLLLHQYFDTPENSYMRKDLLMPTSKTEIRKCSKRYLKKFIQHSNAHLHNRLYLRSDVCPKKKGTAAVNFV